MTSRWVEDRDSVLDLFTATPTRDNMHRYINMWNQNGVDGLGKRQTLMWGYERPDGKGRGVGFTGGHYHHTWAIDGVRTAVLNAIVWTAGMKVPPGGVTSKALTEDEFNANLDDYGAKTKRLKLPDPAEIQLRNENAQLRVTEDGYTLYWNRPLSPGCAIVYDSERDEIWVND